MLQCWGTTNLDKVAVPPVAISIDGGAPTQLRCSKNGRTRNTRLAASTGQDFHNWSEIDVSKNDGHYHRKFA